MAISFATALTRNDVRAMLITSEGRRTPLQRGNGQPQPGHSGKSHVTISNAEMRSRRLGGEIPLATSFQRLEDQVSAAFAILTSSAGDEAREIFNDNRGNVRVVIESRIPAVHIRCSTEHRSWAMPMTAARMVVDRGASGRIHIQTCFPVLQLSRGRDACWRS